MANTMRLGIGLALLGVLTLGGNWLAGGAESGPICHAGENCGPGGCQNVGCQLICQQVVEHKPIKKTVYSCQPVPYCLSACPNPLQRGQTCCHECEICPRYKRVLLKKEIVVGETCETKCVVTCLTHGTACGHGPAACGVEAVALD